MRTLIKRIAAIAIVTAAVLVIFAYYYDIIDFPFIRRPKSFPNDPDKAWEYILGKDEKTAEPTVTAEPTAEPSTAEPTSPTETSEPTEADDYESLIAKGYKPYDGEYGASCVLAEVTPSSLIGAKRSDGRKSVTVFGTEKDTDDGIAHAVYTTLEVERLTVEVYMGMLLVDNGNGITVTSPNGEAVLSYGYGEYEPAYTRDTTDRPLFSRAVTETVEYNGAEYETDKTLYYYIEDNRFVLSDYHDITDSRGLYFDYPSYYGKSDNGITKASNVTVRYEVGDDGKLKITESADCGYSVTGLYYERSFNYSEGRGLVSQTTAYRGYTDRMIESLMLMNEYGSIAYRSLDEYYIGEYYYISSLRLPLSNGAESIGSFYLSYGYMMAREVVIEWYSFNYSNPVGYEKVYSDKNVIVDGDGNRLDIPAGFEVKAYSSGMILVYRDGKYGYLDTKGSFAVQPSLTYAEPFYCGLAVVGDENGTYMIDTDGNTVIQAGKYDIISHSSSGVIAAYGEIGWTIIQIMKKAD